MGPRRRQFWLPLTRLGVFFAAVVVAGNVVFHTFRPDPADASPGSNFDFVDEKKRQFHRLIQLFFGAPSEEPAKQRVGSETPEPAKQVALVATTVEPATVPAIAAPQSAQLGYLEPELPGFVWPEPMKPRASELPRSLSLSEETEFRAGLVTEFYRREKSVPGAPLGNLLLLAPELLLDELFSCTTGMSPRCESRPWNEDENRSLSSRLLSFPAEPRSERIYSALLQYWTAGERNYLAHLDEWHVGTVRPDPHADRLAYHEFIGDQRKLLWDALKRAYFSRYPGHPEDRFRDEADAFGHWQGADFLVLPPLLSAYLFYRGFDKTFTLGESRLRIAVEPLSEWVSGRRDLPVAAGVEWSMNGLPLRVIVTAGLRDGRAVCDFVGIGTSLGAVRKTLALQAGDRP